MVDPAVLHFKLCKDCQDYYLKRLHYFNHSHSNRGENLDYLEAAVVVNRPLAL
jgi:hypothetical protein